MKMYSLMFGFTGSVSVMAKSREDAIASFERLKEDYPSSFGNVDYSTIVENNENECFVNFADE